ncbi:MAG TPA: hypothetical protein VMM92_12490, partial [Thermoanaerobaculia bacterium]|nr:hypothetical protein [Thermoanaerobaculia bacterium]
MSGILDKLRGWGRPWVVGTEPVEIHRALLEEIESQVVAVGGGRRVFPFDRVEVRLLATTPEERGRLEAIAQAGWDLVREVGDRLKAQGVRLPEGLTIPIEVTEERGPEFGDRRYALTFRKAAAPEGSAASRSARPALRLAIAKGRAAAPT